MTPAENLSAMIERLRWMAEDRSVSHSAFMDVDVEIKSAFKRGGLGPDQQTLWSEYQSVWDRKKLRRQQEVAESHIAHGQIMTKIAITVNSAKAATRPEEARRAVELAQETREFLRGLPRMEKQDWEMTRTQLDQMHDEIGICIARVQKLQAQIARAAYGEALSAFHSQGLKEAFGIYKDVQQTIKQAWLSKPEREGLHRDMQALYERFQAAWDQRQREFDEKQEAWRHHQQAKRQEFIEKAQNAEEFAARQRSSAASCRERAYSAKSSEFASRMHSFADEHEHKASEADEQASRLYAIIRDIEAKLRS